MKQKEYLLTQAKQQTVLAFSLLLLLTPLRATALTAHLVWSPSSNPEAAAYNIYRSGNPDSGFILVATIEHPDTAYRIEQITPGQQCFYATTTVDADGNESGLSQGVEFDPGIEMSARRDPSNSGISLSRLHGNYPNPFNPRTSICYMLSKRCEVHLRIHDILGRVIAVLVGGEQDAGEHVVAWDGTDQNGAPVASGPYYCILEAGTWRAQKKMLLLK